MNLLTDIWLPISRLNGEHEKIAIREITKNSKSNPIIEIAAPRPDLKNALYQLLIGILQVVAIPEDEEEWQELWKQPYTTEVLNKKLLKYEKCFNIDSEGPAFMQDYHLEQYNENNLTNLFIELPSNEHFNKKIPQKINPYWGAVVLYALQTFGPAGGRGLKTGLRGGGPLTTLLLPLAKSNNPPSLWDKLWINIFPKTELKNLTGDVKRKEFSDIFPWMKPTKISTEKGSYLYPSECHPLHMYFGMPRRIRLCFKQKNTTCDLTGETCDVVVDMYKQYHSGNDYKGPWMHPLNAYRKDPKKSEEPPYSVKGQPGGVTYRHWRGLALNHQSDVFLPAFIVQYAQTNRKNILKSESIKIWAAGYDLSNIKARCWYDSIMPVYSLNKEETALVETFVTEFINASSTLVSSLRKEIKNSWFNSPGNASGDMSFLDNSFWQDTEPDFYHILDGIIKNLSSKEKLNSYISEWQHVLRAKTYKLFDQWALAQQEDGLDMRRVIIARHNLGKAIGKVWKDLNIKMDE